MRTKRDPGSERRSVQIVESLREGEKIRQRVVRSLGSAYSDAEEVEMRKLGEKLILHIEAERVGTQLLFDAADVARPRKPRAVRPKPTETARLSDLQEKKRVTEGIEDVLGKLYDELGFSKLGGSAYGEVVKATVLSRIAAPSSKRHTARVLANRYDKPIALERIYRMMDRLYKERDTAQSLVRHQTWMACSGKVDVTFFDVTTLYFESVEEDELRRFGYSKDQKFHMVQVVLALATTEHGLPVGYKLFHGATAEVTTLMECLSEWRKTIDLGRVLLVADRGMCSQKNIDALEKAGIEYAIGMSLRKLKPEMQKRVLDQEGYRIGAIGDDDLGWARSFELPSGQRLIAGFGAKRARKDASDRQRIVDKMTKLLGQKSRGPLKKLVSNRGYIKYSQVDGEATIALDTEKITRDAHWDGMWGVVTNSRADAFELRARYRRLWTIEQAFRVTKHDLAMRPIFHWKKSRIEAHVSLCFLAYALVRHTEHRLRQRNIHLSPEAIRDELIDVQASLLEDKKTGLLYRLPSAMSDTASRIYAAFDIPRNTKPELLSA